MNRNLCVGNLSPKTDQPELPELFSEAGHERRPDALDDGDQRLSSRHAPAAPWKEREECHRHSTAGCLDMLDEGGPLRAGD
jgi:RNA recognition motif-containing protein